MTAVDKFGCVGNTIRLASGYYIDLANPKPCDIRIDDIASGLGNICRFGGQIHSFYSVAEHCIHAAQLALDDGVGPDEAMTVLLHDAAEAYVGDVVKPLKVMIGEAYAKVERRIESAIGERFNARFETFADSIKDYDRTMLIAEKRFFVGDDGVVWNGEGDVREIELHPEMLDPSEAKIAFLRMFNRIFLSEDDQ